MKRREKKNSSKRNSKKSLSCFISRDRARSRSHTNSSQREGKWLQGEGEFCGSRSGFGFVRIEGLDDDVFISEDRTLGAIHGDRVELRYREYTDRFGSRKIEGRITKILDVNQRMIIGTLCYEPSFKRGRRRMAEYWYVVADDPRITVRPVIVDGIDAEEGDKVAVKLLRSGYATAPEGEIVANLGKACSREANYDAILLESGIPTEFTDAELAEAARVAKREVSAEGRVDFRGQSVLTIDGEGAKDLDDAVGIKKRGTGWRLYVHIADVSSYVAEKTALDRAAMQRGTSVYFTDKVVPMLPPSISNGACSLNAGEPKHTLTAIVDIGRTGDIEGCEVVRSIIESRVRGVYSEVNQLFGGGADASVKEKYKPVSYALKTMRELYLVLKKKSLARGALELELPEAEIVLNGEGHPIEIHKRVRGEAEKMIEQFMLAANEGVATLLNKKGIPCVYRVHDAPSADKLSALITYLYNLGLDVRGLGEEGLNASRLGAILAEAEEKGVLYPVSYTLLRSMAKAEYSEARSSHFGLGLECYCHFTSPIRRLSDLATHRIIHRVLLEGKAPAAYASYARRAARAATECELRALGAERRIEDLYKVIYMADRVGEEMDAMITSVTSFGMFVEPENTCEGLIPLSEMPGYFIFDERNITLRDGGRVYRLGETVRVRLEEADILRGKLRYSLVPE
ncbi:MAG: VacB/RNase II family 3'-5' exoribonuclease [Clostridia bacterium]|nr:VacB/RNase II family 3'-5' exoribonuclease [Clostridia bacterium]